MTAEEQIRAEIAGFARAYRAKDIEALLASYSEDLIKDRAGAPAERKGETAARIRQVFVTHDTGIEVEVSELVVAGDLAYVRGSFVVSLTPKAGGAPLRIARRYLEIWRNEGGTWRVTRTMDNATS